MRTGVDHQSLTDLVHHSLLQVDVAAEDGGRLMRLDPAPKLDAAPVDETPIARRQSSPGRKVRHEDKPVRWHRVDHREQRRKRRVLDLGIAVWAGEPPVEFRETVPGQDPAVEPSNAAVEVLPAGGVERGLVREQSVVVPRTESTGTPTLPKGA